MDRSETKLTALPQDDGARYHCLRMDVHRLRHAELDDSALTVQTYNRHVFGEDFLL